MKGLQLVLGCGLFVLTATAVAQVSLPSDSTSSFIKKSFNPAETASIKHLIRTEDISVLKDLFGQQLSVVDKNLNHAATLQYHEYEKGKEISRSECEAYEALISKNYPLHTYIGMDNMVRKGVNVCSPTNSFLIYSSLKYTFSNKAVDSSFNLRASAVVTVEYDYKHSKSKGKSFGHTTTQYLIDNDYRMLELVRNHENSEDNFSSSYVSALDNQGNVYYKYQNAVGFIPAQGELAFGERYFSGTHFQETAYRMPYDTHWEAYEVSVDEFPLYKVNNIISYIPSSIIHFKQYTNLLNNDICEHGYIGFDTDGSLLREFGNPHCYAIINGGKRKVN